MYCLCSDKSFEEIIQQQRSNPLSFEQVIERYTSCRSGCGSCIVPLREKLDEFNMLIETDHVIEES